MKAEEHRLQDKNWKKWGPYLSERQWGTVREDYSPHGTAWDYFPHDHARSRTYRWGEDGIAGISDQLQRICFAVTLWNGKDPILKERLFGLSGNEGNHGEDVKELYYYLDSTPTHSYMKHLYKYPQSTYPYTDLVETNRRRSRFDSEYEISDTGIFDDNRYFNVYTEYAKSDAEDIFIRITVNNAGPEAAYVALLPTLWFRNLWSFGESKQKPLLYLKETTEAHGVVKLLDYSSGEYYFYFDRPVRTLFTENETNVERLFGEKNKSPFVKDAFHTAVINNNYSFFHSKNEGTKCAPLYEYNLNAGESIEIRLRLAKGVPVTNPFTNFEEVVNSRKMEADEFYSDILVKDEPDLANIQRQAFAGMLWSKQYFNIDIPRWLNGDPGQPPPPQERKTGRNHQWQSLNNEDIISMPDKWEYPWYAAWDLAFHCVPLAMIDPEFSKEQLLLFLREWYMHPNGQLPAYEWAFGDVNPPVHAWSCLQVYRIDKERTGKADTLFLEKAFQKLLINFTWWVNRKDHKGKNVFEGGFLGLDNIGVFDRSSSIPGGGMLEQADGTSWMAMYCLNMLEMALEISQHNPAYEDVTTKFFEHFIYIAESLNRIGEDWTGSWDEDEGFFYDVLSLPGNQYVPLKVRSLVGLSTLFAVLVLKKDLLEKVPDFAMRLKWFINYRDRNNQYAVVEEVNDDSDILLSLVPKSRLMKLLSALLDEKEFLSPGGIRSLSKKHSKGYSVEIAGESFGLNYQPAEGTTSLFGGNSNWRGPVWMPMNYLLIRAIENYGEYYLDELKVEFPTGSGKSYNLATIAEKISQRLISIFTNDGSGRRLFNGGNSLFDSHPDFNQLILFHEYFHGDTAKGLGASHQTGWTGIVAEMIHRMRKESEPGIMNSSKKMAAHF